MKGKQSVITRRKLLIALGLNALIAGTFAPSANAAPRRGKVLRVGLLDVRFETFSPDSIPLHQALLDGLRARGYELGRDIVLEYRSAQGDPERLPDLAAELVRLNVDMLITFLTGATLAARDATKTIPIVMLGATDPVATGIVASLARPGGNITGVSINAAEMSAKRVELLKEAVPKLSRAAVLWNSSLRSMTIGFQQIEMASPKLGVTVQSIRVPPPPPCTRLSPPFSNHQAGVLFFFLRRGGGGRPPLLEFFTSITPPRLLVFGGGGGGGGGGVFVLNLNPPPPPGGGWARR